MENDNTIYQNPNKPLDDQHNTNVGLPSEDFLQPPPSISQNYTAQPIQPPVVRQPQQPQQSQQISTMGKMNAENNSGGRGFGGLKKVLSILASVLIILGLIAILATFILPGINKNTSGGDITLTYWGLFEDSNVMQGIISDFEKQNPNIKVVYTKEDISQYRDRLTTRIANGTGPDIFRFHNTWVPMIKSYLLPLSSETISPEEFKSIYYPVAQRDLIKNGAIYGIPLQVDTLALYINTQLFQAAGVSIPTNWVDFQNTARALTVKDSNGKIKTAGAALGTYANVTHAPDILSMLFLENSVDMDNFSNSNDRVTSALTFYKSFTNNDNAVWDSTLDPSQLAFSKGNLAMYFGYSNDYFTIKQFNPNLSFQIAPVPQLATQNITLASYWVEGASIKSKHQKEALMFLKFLAKKETLQKLYQVESKNRDFGEPYSRIDLADELKSNPTVYPFIMQAPFALSSPFVDSTYDDGLNQQLNTYLQAVVENNQFYGYSKDTIDTFVKNVTTAMQRYSN